MKNQKEVNHVQKKKKIQVEFFLNKAETNSIEPTI